VLTDTYVLILFRVFKCSYNYQHLEHDARDDNLVYSDVRNVNTQSPPEGGLASPDLPFPKPLLSRRLLSGPWSVDYGCPRELLELVPPQWPLDLPPFGASFSRSFCAFRGSRWPPMSGTPSSPFRYEQGNPSYVGLPSTHPILLLLTNPNPRPRHRWTKI
jgi:hypothetical protein